MDEIRITLKPKTLERAGFIIIIIVLLVLLLLQMFKPSETTTGKVTTTTTTLAESNVTALEGEETTTTTGGTTATTQQTTTTTTTTTLAITTELGEALTVEVTKVDVETAGHAEGFGELKTVSLRIVSKYYTDVDLQADFYLYDNADDSDSKNFPVKKDVIFPTIHTGAIEIFTREINKEFNGVDLEQTLVIKISPRFEEEVIKTVTHRFRV